jgi:hypothetical protein
MDGACLALQIGQQEFSSSVAVGFSCRRENLTTAVIINHIYEYCYP